MRGTGGGGPLEDFFFFAHRQNAHLILYFHYKYHHIKCFTACSLGFRSAKCIAGSLFMNGKLMTTARMSRRIYLASLTTFVCVYISCHVAHTHSHAEKEDSFIPFHPYVMFCYATLRLLSFLCNIQAFVKSQTCNLQLWSPMNQQNNNSTQQKLTFVSSVSFLHELRKKF